MMCGGTTIFMWRLYRTGEHEGKRVTHPLSILGVDDGGATLEVGVDGEPWAKRVTNPLSILL